MPTIESRDEYLKALGLFTLAQSAAKKVIEYEKALADMLGNSDGYSGHVSDAIWVGEGSFDEALKSEGVDLGFQSQK